jgi:membrane protein implicated in regulation of membrane protease activity
MDSRNFGRFVLALIISFLVIIGLGVLVVILFIPAIVGLTIFWAIFGILAAIFALVFAGSFLWYIAREEPKDEHKNVVYSIDQGKDV